MILKYVFLFLFVILASLLIAFLFYVFVPFTKKDTIVDQDPFISKDEVDFIKPNVEPANITDKKAIVLCSCNKNFKVERTVFNNKHTCFMINSENGTGTDCKFSCIGLGDCVKVCPQQAISIVNHTAVISNLCIGCGNCIDICPLHIIKLIPKDKEQIIKCSNENCEPTSCSDLLKEDSVSWYSKKHFKLWTFCYKIIKSIIKS